MQLVFRDINPTVAEAVRLAFDGVDAVDVACGSIFDAAPADAIISPANSHGFMDGGIDALYVRRWGQELENELRHICRTRAEGYTPVGFSVAVPTGAEDVRWMIAAPTMYLPGPVPDSSNAYLAFRAALRMAQVMEFRRVLCPGLATLTGRMAPAVSAWQMRAAWNEVMG